MAHHRIPSIPRIVSRMRAGKPGWIETSLQMESGDLATFSCAHAKTGVPFVDTEGKPIEITVAANEVYPSGNTTTPIRVNLRRLGEIDEVGRPRGPGLVHRSGG